VKILGQFADPSRRCAVLSQLPKNGNLSLVHIGQKFSLTASLDSALNVLVDDDALTRRIDVRHVDQIAYQLVSKKHGRLNLLHRDDEKARWERLSAAGALGFNAIFLEQEWREVVLAQAINSESEYRAAPE
jgi:hypothetical protein